MDEELPSTRDHDSQAKRFSKHDKQWNTIHLLFIAAITMGYFGAIIPVALTPAMIPALESDENLHWDKKESGFFLFSRSFFESCGLLTIGFLSDAYGGRRTFTTYEMSAAMFLVILASVNSHIIMFLSLIFIALGKGTAFPAMINMIGLHLPPHLWDISMIFVGCASRLGSSFTPMCFGSLLRSMEWEVAVPIMALVVAVFCLFFNMLMDLKEEKSGHATQARLKFWRSSEQSSLIVFCKQLEMLFSSPDAWLMLGTIFGEKMIFQFESYTAIIAHGVYGASVPDAAAISSAYPSGQLCGLIVDVIILLATGADRGRRVLYVIAWFSSLLVFGVLVFLLTVPVGPANFSALAFLLGSLGVQLSYVPIGVFGASEASSGRMGSALCVSIVEGMVGMTCGSFNVYTAYIRSNWSEYSAMKVVLISMLVGCSVTIPCFTTYIWRNWNAPVLNPAKHSDDAEAATG